jgi:hypothetical protein
MNKNTGGVGPKKVFQFMGQFRKKEAFLDFEWEFGAKIALIRDLMDRRRTHKETREKLGCRVYRVHRTVIRRSRDPRSEIRKTCL